MDTSKINLDALAAYYAQKFPYIDPSPALATTTQQIGGAPPTPTPPTQGDPWAAIPADTAAQASAYVPPAEQKPPIDWAKMMSLAQAGISPLAPKYIPPPSPPGGIPGGGPQGKISLAPPGTPVQRPVISLADLLGRLK